jgi:hypothetical protein
MRYFVITYFKKANGQHDEQVEVTRNLRTRDIQCANVILDFKKMEVVKASANGQSVIRDWNRIHDFYLKHYPAIFTRLHAENGREIIIQDEPIAQLDKESNPE